jgi:AraC-like DNA-binding protein
MPPTDHLFERPWLHMVVHGVRRGFQWTPPFLRRIRIRSSILYWNPTPGAAVDVAGRRHLPDRHRLLLIPAGTWFQRSNLKPFDHWWCHLRLRGRPGGEGAHDIAVTAELGRQLAALWRTCWDDGVSAPPSLARAHAVVALALADLPWDAAEQPWGDERLDGLVDWLAEQGYPHASNAVMARRVGMHPKAFCRAFSQVAGSPPQDWLRVKRLELAAERLEQGLSIADTADAGGFSDRFHFGRLFRRHHGVSPGTYQRTHLDPST